MRPAISLTRPETQIFHTAACGTSVALSGDVAGERDRHVRDPAPKRWGTHNPNDDPPAV
jgi:hypothetical protein